MLTALDEKGKLISLAVTRRDSEFQKWKRKRHFYCPVCKEPLILKAGEIRIPHFSHRQKSNCASSSSEPESTQHLQGKKHLYDFFSRHGFETSLEYYLPDIQQRPDLLVKKENDLFAVEFQCSPLSRRSLEKRTQGYIEVGITPVWIIGGLPFKRKKQYIFELSDFHWSLNKFEKGLDATLLSYFPENRLLYQLSHITPITSRKVFAILQSKPLLNTSFPFQYPQVKKVRMSAQWLYEKRKWLENKVRYSNIIEDSFLKAVYSSGNNPFLLPVICGIPSHFLSHFQSHSIIWQFYIWKDCLKRISVGQRISLKYVKQKIKYRITNRDIICRLFLFQHDGNWEVAIEHYFYLLVELKYFKKIGIDLFELHKMIAVPKHIEEANQDEGIFYQSFHIDKSQLFMNPVHKAGIVDGSIE